MSVRLLRPLLAVASALALPVVLLAGPASAAVPTVSVDVVDPAYGPGGAPFSGEEFGVFSNAQPTGFPSGASEPAGVRNGWRCSVDAGNGRSASGQWFGRYQDTSTCGLSAVTYDRAGTYTLRITVTDPSGQSSTATRVLSVVDRPTQTVRAAQGTTFTVSTEGPTGTSFSWVSDPAPTPYAPPQPAACAFGDRSAPTTTVTCYAPGTHRLWADAQGGGTSREVVVQVGDVAPAPSLDGLYLDGAGPVKVDRVYTGDAITVQWAHGDPGVPPYSLAGQVGLVDRLTCRYSVDGVETRANDTYYGPTCLYGGTLHTLETGTRRVGVSVVDSVGATGTASQRVPVRFRAASGQVVGRADNGGRVDASMAFTRQGLTAALDMTDGEKHRVRASGATDFSWDGSRLVWSGPATIDGRDRGGEYTVSISREPTDGLPALMAEYHDSRTVIQDYASRSRLSNLSIVR